MSGEISEGRRISKVIPGEVSEEILMGISEGNPKVISVRISCRVSEEPESIF